MTTKVLLIGGDKIADLLKIQSIIESRIGNNSYKCDFLTNEPQWHIDECLNPQVLNNHNITLLVGDMNDVKFWNKVENDYYDIIMFDYSTTKFCKFHLLHIQELVKKLTDNGEIYMFQEFMCCRYLNINDYVYYDNFFDSKKYIKDKIYFDINNDSFTELPILMGMSYNPKKLDHDNLILKYKIIMTDSFLVYYNKLMFQYYFDNVEYVNGNYLNYNDEIVKTNDRFLDTDYVNNLSYYRLTRPIKNMELHSQIIISDFIDEVITDFLSLRK
ncbi:hypothetical protein Hokovirus_2_43 [Hokovirus HKV1]|uniref:Methyltransferase n=1 Tax=Hokovirus HKV1 TaxID=1977638 RepID=A0A1V0SFL2_9VIRU|nr:hypothetical protein Hokovirus_2_43 [Hokovirus HKV1]